MLVVAHGGTNRAILSRMARGGLESLASFEQDECCLNVLDVDVVNGGITRGYVRAMNLTTYNSDREGLVLTTLERIVADRGRRRCQQPVAGRCVDVRGATPAHSPCVGVVTPESNLRYPW